jgi:hypothetical protein
MFITARRLAPIAFAGAAAIAVLAAPTAAASDEPHMTCVYQGSGNSQCETPGNAQLTASPSTHAYPQYPYYYGGYFGGGFSSHHGGGHGSGGHH